MDDEEPSSDPIILEQDPDPIFDPESAMTSIQDDIMNQFMQVWNAAAEPIIWGESARRAPDAGGVPQAPLDISHATTDSGIVVLEVANWIAAPCADALLADLGATVIKVEAPEGDSFRYTLRQPQKDDEPKAKAGARLRFGHHGG